MAVVVLCFHQQDQQVAQTLLSAVVASVLRDSQRDPEGASSERLRGGLQGALAAMLEGSVRCFPPLVAFVQVGKRALFGC